eukprot:scaffold32708_cov56-Cyclotella_meneghiniana.AAC.2
MLPLRINGSPQNQPHKCYSDHARCEGNVDGIAPLRSSGHSQNSSSQQYDNQLVWWSRVARCGNY